MKWWWPVLQGPKCRQRGRRSGHKLHGHADSDESDSDGDPLTSIRTESSNQLDTGPGGAGGPGGHGGPGPARGIKHSQYSESWGTGSQ